MSRLALEETAARTVSLTDAAARLSQQAHDLIAASRTSLRDAAGAGRLPMSPRSQGEEPARGAPNSLSAASARRILIVEDDSILALDRATRARQMGWDDVVLCRSGEAAIRAFEGGLRPDAVILDVHLGRGMTGIDAALQIRAMDQALPIIFVTAYRDTILGDAAQLVRPLAWIDKLYPEDMEPVLGQILMECTAEQDGSRQRSAASD